MRQLPRQTGSAPIDRDEAIPRSPDAPTQSLSSRSGVSARLTALAALLAASPGGPAHDDSEEGRAPCHNKALTQKQRRELGCKRRMHWLEGRGINGSGRKNQSGRAAEDGREDTYVR